MQTNPKNYTFANRDFSSLVWRLVLFHYFIETFHCDGVLTLPFYSISGWLSESLPFVLTSSTLPSSHKYISILGSKDLTDYTSNVQYSDVVPSSSLRRFSSPTIALPRLSLVTQLHPQKAERPFVTPRCTIMPGRLCAYQTQREDMSILKSFHQLYI